MAAIQTSSRDFFNQLKRLIELPEGVTSLSIHMPSPPSVVTLDITALAKEGSGEEITKTYYLTEIPNEMGCRVCQDLENQQKY